MLGRVCFCMGIHVLFGRSPPCDRLTVGATHGLPLPAGVSMPFRAFAVFRRRNPPTRPTLASNGINALSGIRCLSTVNSASDCQVVLCGYQCPFGHSLSFDLGASLALVAVLRCCRINALSGIRCLSTEGAIPDELAPLVSEVSMPFRAFAVFRPGGRRLVGGLARKYQCPFGHSLSFDGHACTGAAL